MADHVIDKSMIQSSPILRGAKKSVLALQHLIAMFGATILVPILTGFNPSIALFTAGIGTLIFHACTKGKVPVFLGSSFAFIPAILTIKEIYGGDLSFAQGGLMAAGFVYVLLSFLVKKVGVEKIKKALPPYIVGPMIIVIGLNMIPTAFSMARENLIIAGVTLGCAILINLFTRGFVKQLGILIAVVTGYLISLRFGFVDTEIIKQSSIVAIPTFNLPKFDIGAIAMTVPVILAVFMEHLGDITTNGQVVGKNFIEDPGLNRTLLGDGLATIFASLVGGPANTTYGENTGVLALTKNYDPSILRLAAIFAIGLAFVSKVGGVLSSIPTFVMGGISLMLFSMISLIGFKTIKNEKVEFNFKNTIIMATILILGLGGDYLSSKLGFTIGIPISKTVNITGLSFAALIGILLNGLFAISSRMVGKTN